MTSNIPELEDQLNIAGKFQKMYPDSPGHLLVTDTKCTLTVQHEDRDAAKLVFGTAGWVRIAVPITRATYQPGVFDWVQTFEGVEVTIFETETLTGTEVKAPAV